MDLHEAWNATKQWVPFASRTIAFGTVSLLFGPLTKERTASLWAMRRWCQSSARGLDIGVRVSGLENLPPPPFVYCSNHQSVLDILVLGGVLPHDFKWAAKRSLMKIPFLGWHLQLAGHVPVDRKKGSRQAAEVIARFEEVLKKGKPLLIFPEGTRSEDGIIRSFKNGGFYAAVRAGVPVVPIAIEGTHRLMRKGAIAPPDGTIRKVLVKVGAPLSAKPDGREAARVTDLRERTFAAVRELHASAGGFVPETPPPDLPSERHQAAAAS
jgi:1-acyl-sn-glycerol-3-phosphate acyltransferase